jgi:PAS domain S-box-containing protein
MPDEQPGPRDGTLDAVAIADALGLPVIATTPEGTITFWNRAAEHLFGHASGDALGASVIDLLVPVPLGSRAQEVMRSVVDGAAWAGDFIVTRADGTPIEVEVIDTPIRDAEGVVTGVVGISRDITGDLRTERALVESRDTLSRALEAGRFGTWRWDMATGTVDWDEQLEAIFGLPPGGFDGTFETYQSLLHPEDREMILATVNEAVATKSNYDLEHRVVWPDGSVHWLEGRGSVVLDAAGEVLGTVGCTGDITESVVRSGQAAQLAASLQAGLLPKLPTVAGLDIHTRYRPGEEQLLLGGDFLDVAVTPAGLVAFCIGDVAGHGALSAALGAGLRAGWRALALTGDDPRAWMAGCADLLAASDMPAEMFVTMATGHLSPDLRRLSLLSAGHPPPILWTSAGATSLEVQPLPPLGLLARDRIDAPATFDLPAASTLVMFTDGLFEGYADPSSSDRLGLPAIEAWWNALALEAFDEDLLDQLISWVEAANGGPMDDDVAILSLTTNEGLSLTTNEGLPRTTS